MIRSFAIQNFKSILDARIAFTYSEGKAPPLCATSETLPFLEDGKGKSNRVVPVLAIYGANASGKSNIVQSFQLFQGLLLNGVSVGYHHNILNRKYNVTKFSVDVVLRDGLSCSYSIAYNADGIVNEEFVQHGASHKELDKIIYRLDTTALEASDFSGVTTPDYSEERLKSALRVECSNTEGHQIRPFLRCLVHSFAGLSQVASLLWQELQHRLYISSRNEFFVSQGIDLLAGEDTDEARQAATDEIASLLHKFDLGIEGLSVFRQKFSNKTSVGASVSEGSIFCPRGQEVLVDQITARHRGLDGRPVTFNFMMEESEGSKVVAGLLGICLWAMKTGRTVVIDELDRSLHPFILVSLIKLFKSKRYNVANGQLVFTLHDPTLLDEDMMRVSEIAIVNKTLKEGTTCRRLCDYDGVRNVVNFRRQYLSGAYSGIPFPYI